MDGSKDMKYDVGAILRARSIASYKRKLCVDFTNKETFGVKEERDCDTMDQTR